MSARGIAAVAIFALVSACTNQVSGTPTAYRVPGTVQASMLSVDEVGAVVGVALMNGGSNSEPPPALGADPATCAVAVGPATQSLYARGWTVFWSQLLSDAGGDNTVTQVLGLYPDDGQAGKVLPR
jgi:hypothetical protein